jgi:hypothetical protein
MQPFSRETITDRRQPYVRWTAVVAGAVTALGSWLLLQLLFTGGALSAIDPDEVDRLHGYSIGTSIGSVLAPLIAMFLGGLVAGRIAAYYDRRVSGFHGALVWSIASALGLAFLGSLIAHHSSALDAHANLAASAPAPASVELVDATADDLAATQKAQHAPAIDKGDLIDAARYAYTGRNTFDRNAFVERLDRQTSLSRPEADAVLANLGPDADDFFVAANQLAIHREHALAAAKDAGKGMFAAGIGLLLCLVSAIGGSIIGADAVGRRRGTGGDRRTLERNPGHSGGAEPGSGTHHRSLLERARDRLRGTFHRDQFAVGDHEREDLDRLADRTFDRRHSPNDVGYGVRDVRRDTNTEAGVSTPPDRHSSVFTTARYPVVK